MFLSEIKRSKVTREQESKEVKCKTNIEFMFIIFYIYVTIKLNMDKALHKIRIDK